MATLIRLPPPEIKDQAGGLVGAVADLTDLLTTVLLNTPTRLQAETTSWFRSIRDNRRVGGDPASAHLFGFAQDFAGLDQRELLRRWQALGLPGLDEGDHVHLQTPAVGAVERLIEGGVLRPI